eukprot:9251492-Pyramimonas_sp.AAC.1
MSTILAGVVPGGGYASSSTSTEHIAPFGSISLPLESFPRAAAAPSPEYGEARLAMTRRRAASSSPLIAAT